MGLGLYQSNLLAATSVEAAVAAVCVLWFVAGSKLSLLRRSALLFLALALPFSLLGV